ncbi:zinc metallochaperone AztD [Desertihabitans brevis]|uniref:zinc metallochaperone AztD n=1 Tax=Desertihabitans brevis TaxID=2268447 RepID=UPI001F260BAE|nr:zinc metallochaperone AztD [Desertihabitans brevis]
MTDRRALLAGLGVAGLLTVAACGTGSEPTAAPEPSAETSTARTEVTGTRLAVSYDGGVMVLDQDTLEPVADIPLEGFLRLNPAGDQRHVLVSTSEGFQVLDTGVEVQGHGDHNHYYDTGATLTDVVHPAPEPGHVVRHAGKVALFSDGAGTVALLDPEEVAAGPAEPTWTAPSPHHGVAVPLEDGGMVVSVGTEEERTGAAALDASFTDVTRSDECPGLHGEATAGNGAVLLGCTDGVLLFKDGSFTKVPSPDEYGRIGNQAGSEHSDVVLGDYKTDPDAELERPTRVSLTDTETGELRLVDLPASYSFRSLGRGPEGEALVLGTDGKLHVIDPDSGEITSSIQVTEEWQEPLQWQQPRPTLAVEGEIAYVTEPETSELHVVYLPTGEVVDTATLPHEPNEITGVGEAVAGEHDHEHAEGDEHAHEGEEHAAEGEEHGE